jgi:hypothetical protein
VATTAAPPKTDRGWRLVWFLTAVAVLVTVPYLVGVVLPYYVNDLHHLPLDEVASGGYDPKDLWPQGFVGGLVQLAGFFSLALTPLALTFICVGSAALGIAGLVTGELRRTASAALILLTVACALGLAWFLGDTAAALTAWRMD